MPRIVRRAREARPSDHLAPLVAKVATLAPTISSATARRIALMARTMEEASVAFDACTPAHLLEAGFSPAEIEAGRHLAKAALDALAADGLPEDAVAPFSMTDAAALRRFNARITGGFAGHA